MIYIRRELERKFLRMSEAFKAVMVATMSDTLDK